MSADTVTSEDVHAYLGLLAGSGHAMWGGIDISSPLGRRAAAKWFIEEIDEIEAMRHQIRSYESWGVEARHVAEQEREAAEAARAVRPHLTVLEGTNEFNRHHRSVTT